MKKISETALIASDQEMLNEGLITFVSSDNIERLWIFDKQVTKNKFTWTAIINVHTEKTENDTHYFDGYYVQFPKSEIKDVDFAFVDYCEKRMNSKFTRIIN